MKKLAIVLVVVVGLLVAADFVVRNQVEGAVADAAHRRVSGVATVRAEIGSFPFVPRLALSGDVTSFVLEFEGVRRDPLPLANLRIDVRDIRLNNESLLHADELHIEDVGSATVSARVSLETLQSFASPLGLTLAIEEGRLRLTSAAGVSAEAAVRIDNNTLTVGAGALPLVVLPLPTSDLVPCEAEATVRAGDIELSCTSDHLPQIVIDAVARVDAVG